LYAFTTSDFGFSDAYDSPPYSLYPLANNFLGAWIDSVPVAGNLLLGTKAVTAPQFVSAADIAAGKLQFSPATDAFGSPYASFTFQVKDDGGTSIVYGGGYNMGYGLDTDPTPRTMTIDVVLVNQAPTFARGADQNVTDESGAQVVAGWA